MECPQPPHPQPQPHTHPPPPLVQMLIDKYTFSLILGIKLHFMYVWSILKGGMNL